MAMSFVVYSSEVPAVPFVLEQTQLKVQEHLVSIVRATLEGQLSTKQY